jgi:DNA-binding NtrC family response regulator
MLDAILMLNQPKGLLVPLCAEFHALTDPHCAVDLFGSVRSLQQRLPGSGKSVLVVVPVTSDDKAQRPLQRLRRENPDIPILAVAEAGNVSAAALAIESGANDFLVMGPELTRRVKTALGKMHSLFTLLQRTRVLSKENSDLRQSVESHSPMEGRSTQMQELRRQIATVATIPRPLLITGERGTGKELVARAVHVAANPDISESTGERPIVTVNCAAVSDPLLESELFGHERGAFTGADTIRDGKFALADGGTLFLDEIGNMSLSFQQKLLRVVEYGTYTRVGGHRELTTTARIIAATNANLQDRIAEGKFLSDLYDRLAFEIIAVPPLRERTEDIPLLAHYFLDRFALEIPTLGGKRLAQSAIDVLTAFHFPGNVRELKNIIERAACRDTTNEITPEDLGMLHSITPSSEPTSFQEQIEAFQQSLLRNAMLRCNNNQAAAARELNLTYDQFRYYWRKLGGNSE